jgi:hypothetical protein
VATTNIWLRPVEEDLSMTACLEHSASNLFDFRAAYRLKNLPLKYEQLVLLPFGQHPRLTEVEQDWVDQGLVKDEFFLA